MDWKIRLASAVDAPGVVETIRSVYDEFGFTWEEGGYHADLYELDVYYAWHGHRFWVAEVEDRVIGTTALELFATISGPSATLVQHEGAVRIGGADCALQRLYVRQEARKGGLGSALFRQTIDEARRLGRTAMEIWSDKRFTDAHRLYQRYGARVVGDRICHDPDQSPEWGLVLPLAEMTLS